MLISLVNLARHVRNHDGVALPVALLALVAVTILVTSVLLSSATEVSLSAAHQDATRGLFTAEGAVEAYVAQNQLALAPVNNLPYLPTGGSARDSVFLTVAVLGRVANPTPTFPDDTTFSITAVPVRSGGRQVVAMITKVNRQIDMNVDGGLISGDNVNLKGNTTVSDGSDSQICADSVGAKALQHTSNTTVTTSGNVKIVGEQEQVTVPKADLVQQLFGTDLKTLVSKADVKFGFDGFPPLAQDPITSLNSIANRTTPQLTPYNWGCPNDVYTGCETDTDLAHLPMIAINAGGGTVNVNLSHGQGMLIVYNGNLSIQGNFAYKGVILVEGNFDIRASGTGATAPKIEGAVIGLGYSPTGGESQVDNDVTGTPTIRYNRCAMNTIRTSWQETKSFLRMGGRTFGWFEVVR